MKAKLKQSDDQTNINKYRAVENITEYHIISLLIFLIIIIIKHLFHLKYVCKNVKNQHD